MTIASDRLLVPARAARKRASLAVVLDRESVFSWLMMALPLAFLAALVGYPFFYGILLSLQDRPVARAGTYVGLRISSPTRTIRCSGGWRSTPSSTPASRRS